MHAHGFGVIASVVVACALFACSAGGGKTVVDPTVAIPSASAEAAAPKAESVSAPRPFELRPKTIGLRTAIEGPLVVRADGTTNLNGATGMTRVSDHYSACFVTKSAEVACWGLTNGGTWNGVAKRDPDLGLRDVVDVAINQTHACALTRSGVVKCWGKDAPADQRLPGRALEIQMSMQGTACALLDDGTAARVTDWTEGWKRVASGGEALRGVGHLLACDRWMSCFELETGGGVCVDDHREPDPRKGLTAAQLRVKERIARAPKDAKLAMIDSASAYCSYRANDVACFDGTRDGATDVTLALPDVSEVEVGIGALHHKTGELACARSKGEVSCWFLADVPPALVRIP